MVRFTLRQCAYFIAAADHGGIAQAARALSISQPAVAQAIDKLEALYGLRLFERHHARGVELTPQGRAFRKTASDLLALADTTEREARAIAAGLTGTVRFACFHTVAPFHMTRLVTGFRNLYPDVTVQAEELLQDDIAEGLAAGDLDLALTYDMALDAERLDWQVMARLKPFILLPENHRFAGRASIAMSELAQDPFVMFDGPSSRDYFRGVLADFGIDPPLALNARSMESVRCAVSSGLGFSLSVMRPAHEETYDGGRVIAVPLADDVAPISLVMAWKRGRELDGLAASFVQFSCTEIEERTCPRL